MTISSDAKKKNISSLIQKLNKGKTLTKSELQQIEEFEAEQNRKETTFDVDTTTAATFFGVTSKTIAAWTKAGLPKVAFGTYNLKACFDWWGKEINTGNEEHDESLTDSRRRYWKGRAEDIEMDVAMKKGNLISQKEVEDLWSLRAGEIKIALLAADKHLPIICEMKPAEEIKKIVKAYTYQILSAYTRPGKFCKPRK